jgi:hypothetical protein
MDTLKICIVLVKIYPYNERGGESLLFFLYVIGGFDLFIYSRLILLSNQDYTFLKYL